MHCGISRFLLPLIHISNTLFRYKEIARLTTDRDLQNGYRQKTYISSTGGGSGKGFPMVFATDSQETRQQRAAIGALLRSCGVTGPGDWVMTMHVSGHLYR